MEKHIKMVSVNCCGEVGDVIVDGVSSPPGKTIAEKAEFLRKDGNLWQFVSNEPRGGVFKHINLLVPPVNPDANSGFIIMEPLDLPPMSGSNSICVTTVLLETGILPMQGPYTTIKLEAPAGTITAVASCKEEKVTQVKIQNLQSFMVEVDKKIVIPDIGELVVSTAFGGDSFVLVENNQLGLDLIPKNANKIVEICSKIVKAVNNQLGFSHPLIPNLNCVSFCMIMDEIKTNEKGEKTAKNTVCIRPKKLDRSPCGTGSSARLAYLFHKKKISLNEKFISKSILGTEFECKILHSEIKEGVVCITPEFSGVAHITGEQTLYIDEHNPFPLGYRLTDTWPED